MHWRVFALKYADRNPGRTRSESFILDPQHDAPHAMDYFVWLLRAADRSIVVDTGYDASEATRRGRPILREPAAALTELGVDPATVADVIVTHLHYDHAGCLEAFPAAQFHLQEAEMAYATGPCMSHEALKLPYTAEHVCAMVRRVFSGRVRFYDGDAEIAPGVTVHKVGGHSRGLQMVRVATDHGPLLLTSDAAHFYENFEARKIFPIVVDVEDMLKGFDRMPRLVADPRRIVPGHDPLVLDRFRRLDNGPAWAARLDLGPSRGGL